MKVVNICVDDHANFMYQQHLSLLLAKVDSQCFKLNRHPFKYSDEATIIEFEKISELRADLFIIYHSDYELQPLIKGNVIYYHTGTKFRQLQDKSIFNNHVNLIALPEFNNLIPNQYYLIGGVNQREYIAPTGNTFSHFPSNPSVKGTDLIRATFANLRIPIKISEQRLSNEDYLKELSQSDIYVELFSPKQGAQMYGSFGMTALEAASFGKVVLTQNLTGKELYEKTYGECELVFFDNQEELIRKISIFAKTDISEKSIKTYNWFTKNHSLFATGQRFRGILEKL